MIRRLLSLLRLAPPAEPPACARCRHFGYPAFNVHGNYGHCRYWPPRSGSQGADRWPVMAFDEGCERGFEPSGTTATPDPTTAPGLVADRLASR